MEFLRTYRGALLVVSHDLQLLDKAITRVLHLDDGVLREYKGTYTQYLDARAKDEERLRPDRRTRGSGDHPPLDPRGQDAPFHPPNAPVPRRASTNG